jgi:membrane protein DedA with SNARE-associated domain
MAVFDALLPIFTQYGYIAVFVMLLICGFGVPVPEDVTLVTGGVIAGLGYANVDTMLIVGLAGVLIGDGLMFLLGRWYGQRLIALPFFRKVLTPERFASAQDRFERYGKWVMFVARFLPGLRTPVFFTAGMTRRVPFITWLLMDGFAALISVPVWVYLGYYGALKIDWLFQMVHRGQSAILTVLAVGGVVVLGFWWRRHRIKKTSRD